MGVDDRVRVVYTFLFLSNVWLHTEGALLFAVMLCWSAVVALILVFIPKVFIAARHGERVVSLCLSLVNDCVPIPNPSLLTLCTHPCCCCHVLVISLR